MENVTRRLPLEGTKRCAFTGYRPFKMPFGYDEDGETGKKFKKRLLIAIEDLIRQGYLHMISGGAQEMDIMAAEAVIELKKKYDSVTLELAIPYENQAEEWTEDYRKRWQTCVDAADMMTVISHEFTDNCFMLKNHYLVQQADVVLACFDGQDEGTKQTIEYAKEYGCPVVIIKPEE